MKHRKILVVDDDRQFAETIALRCRSHGWSAETATTPLEAVVSMVSQPPDLLCLDVNLPTANGLDMCEYLARNATVPQRPVIILTGQTDSDTIRRTSRLQAHYVRKTTDLWQRLKPLMEELLGPRQPAQPRSGPLGDNLDE